MDKITTERKAHRPASPSKPGGFRLGITGKMMISISLTLAVVVGCVGLVLHRQITRHFDRMTEAAIASQVDTARERVEGYFRGFVPSLNTVAAGQSIQAFLQESAAAGPEYQYTQSPLYRSIVDELENTRAHMPAGAKSVYVGLIDGNYMLDSTGWIPGPDYVISNTGWWNRMQEVRSDQIAMVGAYEDAMDGALVVTMAVPIHAGGSVVGAAAVDIDLADLQSSLAEIQVGEKGSIAVFDSDGQIVYHPDPQVCLNLASEVGFSDHLTQLLLDHKADRGLVYEQGGATYHGATLPIPFLDWQILGNISEEEFDEASNEVSLVMKLCFSVAALLTVLAVTFNVLRMVRPIKKLSQVAEELAHGELDVAVNTDGNDEISDLSKSISHIVDRLKTYIVYIDEVSAVLAKMGSRNMVFTLEQDYLGEFQKLKAAMNDIQASLSGAMFHILDASDQVNTSSCQMASGAQALAQGATEQASTVEELASAVQSLTNEANHGAESAAGTAQQVSGIGSKVKDSNAQMQAMLQAMDNIEKHSAEIGKIVKESEDIAFQTNILALNAAVEAARAGSAGKGFAVVADEVRNLASKSAESAGHIAQLIENTISAVKNGVDIAHDTAASLEEVAADMSSIVASIDKLSESYQSEAGALQQIATGIDQVASVVQTNSATAEESAATAEELASQVNMMKELVDTFQLDDRYRDPFQDGYKA